MVTTELLGILSLTQTRTPMDVKARILPTDYWTDEQFEEKKQKQLENQEKKAKAKHFAAFQTLEAAAKEYHLSWDSAEVASAEVYLFDRKAEIKATKDKEKEEKNAKEADEVKKDIEELQAKLDTLKPLRKPKGKRKEASRRELEPYIRSKRSKASQKAVSPPKEDEEDQALAARLEKLKHQE